MRAPQLVPENKTSCLPSCLQGSIARVRYFVSGFFLGVLAGLALMVRDLGEFPRFGHVDRFDPKLALIQTLGLGLVFGLMFALKTPENAQRL